jgi:RNA polymerase sigma factor (sigma-70 family)
VISDTKAYRFETVILVHMNAAYNLARWLTRNDQDAQDVVQEAFIRAYRYFDEFHGDNGRPWLLAIVRNTTFTWLKKHRHRNLALDEEAEQLEENGFGDANTTNPEVLLTRFDDQQLINTALEKLPLEFREILVLRELEELSYKEIARIIDVPLGTVMSRLARARKMLLKQLYPIIEESTHGL